MLNYFFPQVKYRHWLYGLLIALLVVFGLVSIVYEEWGTSSDNIINNLTAKDIGFYLHLPNSLSNNENWQTVPADLKVSLSNFVPDFFSQEDLIGSFSDQEHAYVIFNSDNKNYFGWLVYWPQQTLPVLNDGLTVATSGNLLIISNQAEEIKNKYFNNILDTESLLTKVWPGFSRPTSVPYGYVNFNNLTTNYNSFNLTGSWRWEVHENYLEVVSLEKIYNQRADYKNKQWFDTFYGEGRLFYNLKADELVWLWQQDQSQEWYQDIKKLQAMTGINIEQELLNSADFYDLVIATENKGNKQLPAWLLSLPAKKNVSEIVNKIIAKILGYYHPEIKETILPDKTTIKEFIATEQEVNYQIYNLSGQDINIIYFNSDDYFFYTLMNNRYFVGNDLKLLNRLITKAQGQEKNSICQDNPESNYSFKIADKLFGISYWNNKKQAIYRVCY